MNPMTRRHTWTRLACALSLGVAAFAAQADEGALYGPQAPKGSAFVRAYNAGNSELDVSVGSTSLNDVAPLGSSDFKFLPPAATPPRSASRACR